MSLSEGPFLARKKIITYYSVKYSYVQKIKETHLKACFFLTCKKRPLQKTTTNKQTKKHKIHLILAI